MTNITNLTDLLPAETVINPFGNGTVNNAKWVGLDKEGVLSYYLRVSTRDDTYCYLIN